MLGAPAPPTRPPPKARLSPRSDARGSRDPDPESDARGSHDADPESDAGGSHDADVPEATAIIPRKINRADLPIVDPKNDPRVFALLDEGCNTTCPTETWFLEALQRGMKFSNLEGAPQVFEGLGHGMTTG